MASIDRAGGIVFRVAVALIATSPTMLSHSRQAPQVDVQSTLVGNPLRAHYPDGQLAYARNIWAMHPFDGRLFVGHGSGRNTPPAVNTGPTTIWAYDPQQAAFVDEFIADDEEINSFIVVDDVLYAPGHDAREDWSLGNIYRRPMGGAWEKLRTVPNGVHVEDLLAQGDGLYAAIGLGDTTSSVILRSLDGGQTWPDGWRLTVVDERLPTHHQPSRVYALWEAGGTVWANAAPAILLNATTLEPVVFGSVLYRLEGDAFVPHNDNLFVDNAALFHKVTHTSRYADHAILVATPYVSAEEPRPARWFAMDDNTLTLRALPLPHTAHRSTMCSSPVTRCGR